MNESLNFLGARIKELRKNKKYTQDKFAELIGIDAKHLSRVECSRTQPSLNLLNKISKVLEIDILELFKIEQNETQRFKNKKELINEINLILDKVDTYKVKLFYKILKTLEE
ncbi:MAG: helix-turn-helix transcriptional regulator [Candidatus Gastranaerophilales bacterium]|nr:helix-turn-helix transcriptional regulator [Candidatus Gastranaerophilales bacterium]